MKTDKDSEVPDEADESIKSGEVNIAHLDHS
jgi:hypothetical protein